MKENQKNQINYVKPTLLDLGSVTNIRGQECTGGNGFDSWACDNGPYPSACPNVGSGAGGCITFGGSPGPGST